MFLRFCGNVNRVLCVDKCFCRLLSRYPIPYEVADSCCCIAVFGISDLVCKGRGALAIGISSVLIAIFCCFAFNLNFADFRILYFPEFILWLASIGILFKDVKQSAFSLLISIPVALSLEYTGLLRIIGIG